MNTILNIVKAWANFTHLKNARAQLVKQAAGNRKLLKAYLVILDCIPFLQWEDGVTRLDYIWDNVVFFLAERKDEVKVFKSNQVEEPSKVYPGNCHAACWHYYQQDPGFEYWLGFCGNDDSTSTDWHLHSFLMKNGVIYEVTGNYRECYTGVRVCKPNELFNFEEFDFKP